MQVSSILKLFSLDCVLLCQNFGFCTATKVIMPSKELQVNCQLYGHQVPTPDTPFLSRVFWSISTVRSNHLEFSRPIALASYDEFNFVS